MTQERPRDLRANVTGLRVVHDFDHAIIEAAVTLREAGFAVHYLHPREKRPVGNLWSEATVATIERLRATHQPGYNLGVRLGSFSPVADGFLHTLDLDIRVADMEEETWDALRALFPEVRLEELPCVQSGSGGASRHLYFITDKPFSSKVLWKSPGKHRSADDKWHYDAEIELFGSGKQVALPPSIHPDTGKPYRWLREFDFAVLDLGVGPFVPSAAIERIATAENATFEFETREPLTFTPDQFARVLRDIPMDKLDGYHEVIMLGQALHHQFGGSEEGYQVWLAQRKRSVRYEDVAKAGGEREWRKKWRGFGRNRKKPVTMATVVEWAKDARISHLRDAFDEEDEGELDPVLIGAPEKSHALPVADAAEIDPMDAALDGDALPAPAPAAAFDDILGGDDGEPEEEEDSIDAIGSNIPVKGQSRAVSGEWISLLDINDKGAIKPTLHNVEMIVTNDPRLAGLPQLNEFTQETVQRRPPGAKGNRRRNAAKQTRQLGGRVWQVRDTLNGELWSDDRDFAIRSILEAPATQGGYDIKVSDRDLKAAVVLAANNNAFHPVREYLESQKWDGTARAESLFTDYVGAPNDAYSRSVSRMMLVAAVTRIFEPGHKFDFAVILEGLQGKRKSTFIRVLGRHWFGELNGNWDDSRQMIEQMMGKWIMEIPELSGFGRADVRSIKAFISTQQDRARLAYARRAGEFPRQCIFIGSTNDREYLRDDTGGRRFWPLACTAQEIDTVRLEQNVDQVWAEAVSLYSAMRQMQPFGELPLYLQDEAAQLQAARLQETRRVESPEDAHAAQIADWLDKAVSTGSIDDDLDQEGQGRQRNEVCLKQIWEQCLGGDARGYSHVIAQSLGRAMAKVPGWELSERKMRIEGYGNTRFYARGGDAGRLVRLRLAA